MPASKIAQTVDFTSFPPGSITEYTTVVCLACIFDIFTAQLHLAPRTAYAEIKRYAPTIDELTSPKAVRPFFDSEEKRARCPYCNAAQRWHARLDTYGIESGKAVDAARRRLVAGLAKKKDQFLIIEKKTDRRDAFFIWLDTIGRKLDLENSNWLLEGTRAYLERLEPKTEWAKVFDKLRSVRRSSRLVTGWVLEGNRLFLSPASYSEALVVQYLISRSHARGGQTLEGRLTIGGLITRLRHLGYLDLLELPAGDLFELLERVIDRVAGMGNVRLTYVVDRRDFLEKAKSVYARYAA